MEYLVIGKVVTTHGIKGEIKILSDFKYKKEVFKKDFKIYIGENKEEFIINSYRVHKNYDMVTLVGLNNINDDLRFRNKKVYIEKSSLKIDGYLDEDLIGLNVIMNEETIGKVKSIVKIPKNNLLEISNNDKIFYIPNNSNVIEKVDIDNKEIIIKYIEGLVEWK